jgi:hypothetical protein
MSEYIKRNFKLKNTIFDKLYHFNPKTMFIVKGQRAIPNDYRGAICECGISIAFHESEHYIKCPKCGAWFYSGGVGYPIDRVKEGKY